MRDDKPPRAAPRPTRLLGPAVLTARLGLAALFVVSAAFKLSDPEGFSRVVSAFGLVPAAASDLVALALPLLELAAAYGLVRGRDWGLGLTTALYAGFIAVLSYGLVQGLDVDCGCFGPASAEARALGGLESALHRDLALLSPVVFLWWRRLRAADVQSFQHLSLKEHPCDIC